MKTWTWSLTAAVLLAPLSQGCLNDEQPVNLPSTEAPAEPIDNPYTPLPVSEPDEQDPLHAPHETRTANPVSGPVSEPGIVVGSLDRSRFFVSDPDTGQLLNFSISNGYTGGVAVGPEPGRMIRVGDTLFVVERAKGQLVRFDLLGDTLAETDRVDVGEEPTDVAMSPTGERIYVALSQAGEVLALDAEMLVEVGRWQVGGQPQWLTVASHDAKEFLYVASSRRPTVRRIVPQTGRLQTIWLPTMPRFSDADCVPRDMPGRITGPPIVGNEGGKARLYVPTLYVDTQLVEPKEHHKDPGPDRGGSPGGPFGHSDTDTDFIVDTFFPHTGSFGPPVPPVDTPHCDEVDVGPEPPRGGGAYGAPPKPGKDPGSRGRVTPAVVVATVDGSGDPLVRGVGAMVSQFNGGGLRIARSYPRAMRIDSGRLYVALPGSEALVRVDQEPLNDGGPFELTERLGRVVPSGVDDMVWTGSSFVTWSSHWRVATVFGAPEMRNDMSGVEMGRVMQTAVVHAGPSSTLDEDIVKGRRLFFSASQLSMSADGSGISCETCHFEGGSDGMTWLFEDMARQTPSLAGKVSTTLPITWTGSVATVIDEIHATTQDRMGGAGLSDADARAVATFVDSTRLPKRPQGDAARRANGEKIFRRADVGCATCHSGDTLSDGDNHAVFGFERPTNTPTLRGIGASAPYLHDGTAHTLRAVLERAKDGSMGNTSSLSAQELDDLEIYLKSL